jgi:hypothetical protein
MTATRSSHHRPGVAVRRAIALVAVDAGGVDRADDQRAGAVVGQHDADRARGDLGRERPDRSVGQVQVGEHCDADLFGVGR